MDFDLLAVEAEEPVESATQFPGSQHSFVLNRAMICSHFVMCDMCDNAVDFPLGGA